MASQYFNNLLLELQRLDEVYLSGVNELEPADRDLDMARAYLVFAHAAIEQYLEEHSEAIVKGAVQRYRTEGIAKRPLVALLCHQIYVAGNGGAEDSNVSIGAVKRTESVETVVARVGAKFVEFLQLRNHGIGDKQLFAILKPIGVDVATFDDSWLVEVKEFVGLRGKAAHLGTRGAFSQAYGPGVARKKVEVIVKGLPSGANNSHQDSFQSLEDIDSALVALCA